MNLRTALTTLSWTLAVSTLAALTLSSRAPARSVQDGAAQDAAAQEGTDPEEAARRAVVAEQLPSYPLETCVVSGKALDSMGGPLDHVVDGRLVRLCCKGCVRKVDGDPATFTAKIDAAVVAAQGPTYPATVCPVSGEALGSMGDPIDVVHGTRLVRLCCKGCVKRFHADPAKVLAKVDAAYVEAQRPHYPLHTCLISGEPLGDDAREFLYGTRLVRVCCPKCEKAFRKDPAPHLAKLDAARAKGEASGDGHGDHGDHGDHGGDHGGDGNGGR